MSRSAKIPHGAAAASAADVPGHGLQIQSTIGAGGVLEIALVRTPVGNPEADEVVVRVEASPVNPSDLAMLLGPADPTSLQAVDIGGLPGLRATLAPAAVAATSNRHGLPLAIGNEGAGRVVRSGSGALARSLQDRLVTVRGGGMYAEYRRVKAAACLALPEGVTAEEGASAFVNPMTALGFLETLRGDGHRAAIQTASASNLGQMFVRLCASESIPLVNVVRSPHQADLLRTEGAIHVLDSGRPDFLEQLEEAIAITGATAAFDAIGGGTMASDLLHCMERAHARSNDGFQRYGSTAYKHVYVYGGLQPGAIVLSNSYGKAWGVSGWVIGNFLAEAPPETVTRLRARIAAEIKTTFRSTYARTLSLREAMDLANIVEYAKRLTGKKVLIDPQRR